MPCAREGSSFDPVETIGMIGMKTEIFYFFYWFVNKICGCTIALCVWGKEEPLFYCVIGAEDWLPILLLFYDFSRDEVVEVDEGEGKGLVSFGVDGRLAWTKVTVRLPRLFEMFSIFASWQRLLEVN